MTKDHKDEPEWAGVIPDEQWTVYAGAIAAARKSGARFLLGGAFGLAGYTGRWRNTKDLDFFVLPADKDRVIDALTKAGFEDYYSTHEYDRGWIYRATRDGVIVDTIWQTPNRRAQVDEQWFQRARRIVLRRESLETIPAEELLAIKVYVLQRDRCDWPDLFNLLHAVGGTLDWDHVLRRMTRDNALLAALLNVFTWVSPCEAEKIPAKVYERLRVTQPGNGSREEERRHVELLDSRKWFAAYQPADEAMVL